MCCQRQLELCASSACRVCLRTRIYWETLGSDGPNLIAASDKGGLLPEPVCWDGMCKWGLQAPVPGKCAAFSWCIPCRQGCSLWGIPPYLGVPGAPGFPWQLSMAESTGSTVSGKSISSWEPKGSLWINWQYQPSCC